MLKVSWINLKDILCPFFFLTSDFLFIDSSEAELVKKQYTKILDAYGCLGVLNFAVGM